MYILQQLQVQNLADQIAQSIGLRYQQIVKLYETFKSCNEKGATYKSIFGFFVSEYIRDLKVLNINNSIDEIFLENRRLLELIITVKYIREHNLYAQVPNYCEYDRKEYLEGCKARIIADVKLFPFLQGALVFSSREEQLLQNLKAKYEKPVKLPPMRTMAYQIGWDEEYRYFYKLTSKLLHFCPFSLNNEHIYEAKIHKLIFILRLDRYLQEIIQELSILQNKY